MSISNRINNKIIDRVNLWLIPFSLILATIIPFKLFLFSYAFLGPLHYLTEINWLDKRNFFTKGGKKSAILLSSMALLVSLYPILLFFELNQEVLSLLKKIGSFSAVLIVSAFIYSIGLIYSTKHYFALIILFCSLCLSVLILNKIPFLIIVVGMLLPTIFHVYLFTLLFILFGAKNAKGKIGFISALAMLLVPMVIYILPIDASNYAVTKETANNFTAGNFHLTNSLIANVLRLGSKEASLLSVVGIKIQIFIAFAYTYHYLNWFTKTSIIGWGKVLNRRSFLTITLLWICAISIYLYNYKTGLVMLLFLSMAHVFLEFPLNVLTIKSLFRPTINRQSSP